MSETWDNAIEYSRKIKIKTLEEQVSAEELREARVERLPEIDFKGHYEYATNLAVYENGILEKPMQHEVIHLLYRVGADMYFNIYDGNKLNLEIDKRKIEEHIALKQKEFTISEIKLHASTYYLKLQQSLIFKELMIKDIAYQEKQLAEIKELFNNGVILKSDLLRVELKLSNQKLILVKIENDIAINNQRLNIIIGLDDHVLINPYEQTNPTLLELKTYETYLNEARSKSYEYHISEYKTEVKKIELNRVKANIRPKVGLYADCFLANPQIFLFPYSPSTYTLGLFGVRGSIPISALYMNKPKMKIAKLELEIEEVEHHHTDDKIRQQVYEAYLRFKESLVRIDVAKVNVDQAAENARIINHNYFNQTSLITDLLDANVQLLQTQFEYASAEIAAQLQYYQLQDIIGTL